jgi:hypothetical protein
MHDYFTHKTTINAWELFEMELEALPQKCAEAGLVTPVITSALSPDGSAYGAKLSFSAKGKITNHTTLFGKGGRGRFPYTITVVDRNGKAISYQILPAPHRVPDSVQQVANSAYLVPELPAKRTAKLPAKRTAKKARSRSKVSG